MTENELSSLKQKGNEFFKQAKYTLAIQEYSKAIALDSSNGTYFVNRSLAHLKLGQYGMAIKDAVRAIELGNQKGFYRRGCAYLALGNYKKSYSDFQTAKRFYPSNKEVSGKLNFVSKEVRKTLFKEAIANELSQPISKRLKLEDFTSTKTDFELQFPLTLQRISELLIRFKEQKAISLYDALKISLAALEKLKKLPNLVHVPISQGSKLNVCGDIHGQYYDLLHIFERFGLPSEKNMYLFNGDFVDRGPFSAECILLLLAFKCLYPSHFFLNRGNHETKAMNSIYGFKNEILDKYDFHLYELMSEIFQWLPIGHLLSGNKEQKRVLVLHGGIFAQDGVTLKDIQEIDRVAEPSNEGILCDALWSDPGQKNGRSSNKRGVSIYFGEDVLDEFLQRNNLSLLVRSHEVKMGGFHEGLNKKCVTVFSAPNYCDSVGNLGAVMVFKADLKAYEFKTFQHSEHPKVKSMKYAMNMFQQ